jgi:hypothetical protein
MKARKPSREIRYLFLDNFNTDLLGGFPEVLRKGAAVSIQ